MSIKLTNRAQALIREKLDSGHYASASDVVEAAVRLLDERDQALARLPSKLQVGLDEIERGQTVPLSPELLDEIDREVEARFNRGDLPDPDVCPYYRSRVLVPSPKGLRRRPACHTSNVGRRATSEVSSGVYKGVRGTDRVSTAGSSQRRAISRMP